MKWVALLRAINLGKTNQVKMAELRELLTDELGYDDVRTLLQSGNVVFATPAAATTGDQLEKDLAAALEERFGFAIPTLVRSAEEWDAVVAGNPFLAAGADPKELHATFLATEPDPATVAAIEAAAHAPNELAFGDRVMYLRLPNGMAGAKLGNGDKLLGVRTTTRNWNTVTKIHALLAD